MVQTVDFARLRRVAKRATPLERRVILRDFLATLPPERFDMGWLHSRNREAITPAKAPVKFARDCGTAACLAGWINTLCAPTNLAALDVVDATQFLGLSKWQGDDLFLPRGIGSPERYPLSRAVETLTRLVETGEVDWGPEPPGPCAPSRPRCGGMGAVSALIGWRS